jgi:protein TonB
MPLRYRISIIAAVIIFHLFVVFNYHRVIPFYAQHKDLTVSFALLEAKQTTLASTLKAHPAVQNELKQASLSKGVDVATSNSEVSNELVASDSSDATVSEVTQSPGSENEPDYLATYLNNASPTYPVVARRLGWQGKVLLSVEVLADGRAGQVRLQHSSGHTVLDEAALNAVKDWHFSPAKHAGQPVDKWFLVPIPFVLKESE